MVGGLRLGSSQALIQDGGRKDREQGSEGPREQWSRKAGNWDQGAGNREQKGRERGREGAERQGARERGEVPRKKDGTNGLAVRAGRPVTQTTSGLERLSITGIYTP